MLQYTAAALISAAAVFESRLALRLKGLNPSPSLAYKGVIRGI
jgi:hypothetical protein